MLILWMMCQKKFKVSTDCALPPWSHLFWGHNSLIMTWFPYQYLYFYPRHYLSHLSRLESQQLYKHSCRAWRQASTWAETGTGTVGEAAAPMTAATGMLGTVVGQQPVCDTCMPWQWSWQLPCPPSQSKSWPRCHPASRPASRPACPFVVALARTLATARGSGNVDIRISSGGLQREVHIHSSIMFPRGPALSCLWNSIVLQWFPGSTWQLATTSWPDSHLSLCAMFSGHSV